LEIGNWKWTKSVSPSVSQSLCQSVSQSVTPSRTQVLIDFGIACMTGRPAGQARKGVLVQHFHWLGLQWPAGRRHIAVVLSQLPLTAGALLHTTIKPLSPRKFMTNKQTNKQTNTPQHNTTAHTPHPTHTHTHTHSEQQRTSDRTDGQTAAQEV